MNWLNKLFRNLLALFLGIIISFFIMEGVLRIYNPFEFRVRGDKIILPVNEKYVIKNDKTKKGHSKFDPLIIHTKNALGFRGKDLPPNLSEYLSIITVGGSTTECTFLSDGKTWTDQLEQRLQSSVKNIWINNAGFDGHSTFGHKVLMEDYVVKLKPDVVLFLIGANDEGREDFGEYDKEIMRDKFMFNSVSWFVKSMATHSEVFSLGVNLYRQIHAQLIGVAHREVDFSFLGKITNAQLTKEDEEHRKKVLWDRNSAFLKSYKKRLETLVDITKKNNIEPVLITQPTLYGNLTYGVDNKSVTHGISLGESLELYNDITRQVGVENNILVIDLAKELPKNTKYYYDFYHYTNEGAEKAAEIIYNNLYPYVAEKYSD